EDGIRDRNVTGVQTCALPILDIAKDGVALVLKLECHESLMKFMVERGSVTLDGISLTLFAVDHKQNTITVNIIPETQKETNIIRSEERRVGKECRNRKTQ